MINTIHVLLVKTTGQVKRKDHPMPGIGIDLHVGILRFVSASALAKTAVTAAPENVTVTGCIEVGQGGPAIAAPGKVDVVD